MGIPPYLPVPCQVRACQHRLPWTYGARARGCFIADFGAFVFLLYTCGVCPIFPFLDLPQTPILREFDLETYVYLALMSLFFFFFHFPKNPILPVGC